MMFFWRQPSWQSELDHLLAGLAKEDPLLSGRKEKALRLQDDILSDSDADRRKKASLLPYPPNPYR